ncbi:hypothetical protein FQ320_06690 [Oceaniovalibus sp. ACAM 378]|nr:hypothetical protein FQ320_06690 [Oceaniovalibus sp. ACAM 378]
MVDTGIAPAKLFNLFPFVKKGLRRADIVSRYPLDLGLGNISPVPEISTHHHHVFQCAGIMLLCLAQKRCTADLVGYVVLCHSPETPLPPDGPLRPSNTKKATKGQWPWSLSIAFLL